MLLAFKLGQVVLVKASSPSCFTFRVSISSSPAVRPWLGNSGGGSGWLKQFGLFFVPPPQAALAKAAKQRVAWAVLLLCRYYSLASGVGSLKRFQQYILILFN